MLQPTDRAMVRLAQITLGGQRDLSARVAPVSVIVPCFRCANTIGSAVASIAAQALPPAEVILVDDGSGDGTLDSLEAIAQMFRQGWIKVLALPRNGGPSVARNRGWQQATQDWIAFLDADDTWHPQKLKIQMEVLAANPQIALLAHRMNVQDRSAAPPALSYPLKVKVAPRHLLRWRASFPTPSLVLRRDLPFRFDESRWRAEDFLLCAQILLSGYQCASVNQVLASLHKPPFGASGLSGDLNAMYMAAFDVRRALHKQGLLGRWQLLALHIYSFARYLRRQVITRWRRFSALRAEPSARKRGGSR